jgi:hypothetical protein
MPRMYGTREAIECASEYIEPLILGWYGLYEDFQFTLIAQCLGLSYALVFALGRGYLLWTCLSDCANCDLHSA